MNPDISPYLNRLASLYRSIDEVYAQLASHYGSFSCEGCTDNCCTTVFAHYTLIENFYFLEGFDALPAVRKKEAIERAEKYLRKLEKAEKETALSIMCPVNFEGLCAVYEQRPLICRVHGLPAQVSSPQKGVEHWNGCLRFQALHGDHIDLEIDRTYFYAEIAALEVDLRRDLMHFEKYRKTIAHMVDEYDTGGSSVMKQFITSIKEKAGRKG